MRLYRRRIHWARFDWLQSRHVKRFIKRVTETDDSLPCQHCGAAGSWVEDRVADGSEMRTTCHWCYGTGRTTRWRRGLWSRLGRRGKGDDR